MIIETVCLYLGFSIVVALMLLLITLLIKRTWDEIIDFIWTNQALNELMRNHSKETKELASKWKKVLRGENDEI